MMAVKARIFQPMVTVWLEDLVPANHFTAIWSAHWT
jgi:hypothetical protein